MIALVLWTALVFLLVFFGLSRINHLACAMGKKFRRRSILTSIEKYHNGVKLTMNERQRLKLWILKSVDHQLLLQQIDKEKAHTKKVVDSDDELFISGYYLSLETDGGKKLDYGPETPLGQIVLRVACILSKNRETRQMIREIVGNKIDRKTDLIENCIFYSGCGTSILLIIKWIWVAYKVLIEPIW